MPRADTLTASLVLSKGARSPVGRARIALLEAVRDHASITLAAKAVGLSYKTAWDAVQAINNLFETPLVTTRVGGRSGGLAAVTQEGLDVIAAFHALEAELNMALERVERRLGDRARPVSSLFGRFAMKTSARNALRGVVVAVTPGAVNSEVVLKIADGVEVVAIITRQSVADLDLAPGREAIALIKASSIILAPVGEALRTSARNRLTGVIDHREDGAVNSEITLVLDAGKVLTATITCESARELDLGAGQPAVALIKASQIILAVE